MSTHRQIVKAADVEIALGKSKSTSAKILRTIRAELKKLPHQPITIEEFSNYYGFDKSIITNVIISNDHKEVKPSCMEIQPGENTPKENQEKAPKRLNKEEPYAFSKRTW